MINEYMGVASHRSFPGGIFFLPFVFPCSISTHLPQPRVDDSEGFGLRGSFRGPHVGKNFLEAVGKCRTPILKGKQKITILGTNISPTMALLKIIFLFPWWDMFVPSKVYIPFHQENGSHSNQMFGEIDWKRTTQCELVSEVNLCGDSRIAFSFIFFGALWEVFSR